MTSPFCVQLRAFASAAGGDKIRVFFGLNRQYSLRDRRIKEGAPQPRKVPFHRIGVAPPGTKYFCRDFQNPTTDFSNAAFAIEYKPFADVQLMEKASTALKRTLPGCSINVTATMSETESFRVTRELDNRVIFERPPSHELTLDDLKDLVSSARTY